MGSAVLKSLSFLLGVFFIFLGTMKVTSLISKELHKDLRKEYVKYAKVFPLAESLDIKIPPKWYRRSVGLVEIISGFLLALVPGTKLKKGANVVLLISTVIAIYSHYMVSDKFERAAPTMVLFFMLTGRLVIYYQQKPIPAVTALTTGNGDVTTEDRSRKAE